MDALEFYDLVLGHFGSKAITPTLNRRDKVVTCVLYESFNLTCGLDGGHGAFGAGIEYEKDKFFTTFLGKDLSLNSDKTSILASLKTIDEWCRLRLPDKFLEAYEAAYGITA